MTRMEQPLNLATGAGRQGTQPAAPRLAGDPLAALLLRLHAWAAGTGGLAECCELLREELDRPWVATARVGAGALDSGIVAWSGEDTARATVDAELATRLRNGLTTAGDGHALAPGLAVSTRDSAGRLPPYVLGTLALEAEGACVLLLGTRGGADHDRLLVTCRTLLPHAVLALAHRRAADQARLDARLLEEILDGTPAGFVVMDAAGEVLSLNRDAREILEAGDGLRMEGRRLASHQRIFEAALEAVLAEVAAEPAPKAARTRGLVVTRPSGKAPYVLTFRTVEMPAVDTRCTPRDRLLLRIVDPVPQRLPCPDFLMTTFGLTRAEARVCQQVATGSKLGEAALALCLSVTTIKSHLRRVYMKLGVGSRTGLLLVLQGALRATGQPAPR